MSNYMDEFRKLRITLKDIKIATNNFALDKKRGHGGYGPVYEGKLPLSLGGTRVAVKRLDVQSNQGDPQFWNEVRLLSEYTHKNLVSLLHFSDEGGEKILVYEYVSRGSLIDYLNNNGLTWSRRLEICIEVAEALKYLHDPNGSQERLIHRDIKSGNILLNEKWMAKVSDFGLAKLVLANQVRSYVVTSGVGTQGYVCPAYVATGKLSKETDVYSFGVVMFELICGRPCFESKNGQVTHIYVPAWKQCCDENRVHDIVFHYLKDKIKPASLMTFSAIARRCASGEPNNRPKMVEIIKELKIALEQENMNSHGNIGVVNILRSAVPVFNVSQDVINIVKLTVPGLSIKSTEEIISILSKGLLVDFGFTWLSLNKSGGLCEMIAAIKCIPNGLSSCDHDTTNSRLKYVMAGYLNTGFAVVGSTNYLIPGVTYNVNLVFKHTKMAVFKHIPFKYRHNGKFLDSTDTHVREDGWLMTRLFQYTSQMQRDAFLIEFVPINEGPSNNMLYFYCEGIEFRPIEN